MMSLKPDGIEAMPIGFLLLRIVRRSASSWWLPYRSMPKVEINPVRRALRQEDDAGRVECLGRGSCTRWRTIG